MTKQELQEAIKDNEIEITYPLDDRETIESVFHSIDEVVDLGFSVELTGNNSSDWWLQCTYYSQKLQKTIIWDYDFIDSFENEDELIDVIIQTNKAIEDFENRLLTIVKY